MKQSSEFYEHRLLQSTIDLCQQLAELRKLRAAVQAAEVSMQGLAPWQQPKISDPSARHRLQG